MNTTDPNPNSNIKRRYLRRIAFILVPLCIILPVLAIVMQAGAINQLQAEQGANIETLAYTIQDLKAQTYVQSLNVAAETIATERNLQPGADLPLGLVIQRAFAKEKTENTNANFAEVQTQLTGKPTLVTKVNTAGKVPQPGMPYATAEKPEVRSID